MKFKNILVPVDLTVYSDKALEYALRLGIRHQSQVNLLYVFDNFNHQDSSIEKQMKEYRDILEKMVFRIEKRIMAENPNYHFVPFKAWVISGKQVGEIILKFIDDKNFDLVVMETHARSGLNHMLLGSVTEKIVRLSQKPVLTVHHSLNEFKLNKILIPVDFSPYSKKAIEYVIPLAREFQADLIFLHVIPHEFHPDFHGASINNLFQMAPAMKTHTTEKLREFTGYSGANATHIVIEGKPCHSIIEYADYTNCDLILMATRGMTGLKHLLVGSTTEKIVRLSERPILTLGRVNIPEQAREEAVEAVLLN